MDGTNGAAAEGAAIVVVSAVVVAGATHTSSTGPILAFAGAVLVALVAAVTAGRRQRTELAAASTRHDAAIAAEAGRLEQQLEHERRIKDVDDLRAFFDEGAAVFEEADDAVRTYAVGLSLSEDDARAAETSRRRPAAAQAANRADIFARRVTLRFESGHSLARSYRELADRLANRYRHLLDLDPVQLTPEQDEYDTSLGAEISESWNAFADEARTFVGVAIPTPLSGNLAPVPSDG